MHAQTWKIPRFMKGYLFICTKHEAFGIFHFFCAIWDSQVLCKVHSFGKRRFFYKYFKLFLAPTLNIPHYMVSDVFIYTQREAFGIFSVLCYMRLPWLCLETSSFWKKTIFFVKYFKLVHAQTWKIPHFMNGFLFMCKRHEAIGTANFFAISATPLCFTRYILLRNMFFHEIFQVGAWPNLKDSSLYERYSIHMCKARSIQYLQQFSSICDSLMPWTVHFFFGKSWFFFMKYFKLVHAPTWNIPQYMKIFLFICTRHTEFGIINFFALSATP